MIGVPKTIDNDLSATDYTFGFDTAVNIAMEAIDRLHTTAESHHRVLIVEAMGRHAGWIALQAGLAGSANVILMRLGRSRFDQRSAEGAGPDVPPNEVVPNVHCLRISKTGTTTLRTLVMENNIRRDLKGCTLSMHGHKISMPDVLQNPNNKVAFFLREPLARFVSGFNHRMTEPGPRQTALNAKEAKVLKHFATPNELAEALTSSNELTQDRAYVAMEVQMHARLHYTDWLVSVDYLESRLHRISFVGFLETYSEDVQRFLKILGVEREIDIPHERRGSDTSPRRLSELAQENLRRWYADDIAIFEWAMDRRRAAKPM